MPRKRSQNTNFQKMRLAYPPRKWKFKDHENVFTTRFGEIKPTHWSFISPGDKFRDSVGNYCRLAPMQSPIFSRVDMKTRMFVVPCRKLQPDFEDFVTSPPSDGRTMINTTIWDMFMAFYSLGQYGFSSPGTLEEFLGVPPVIDNIYNLLNYTNAPNTWVYSPITPADYQGYNVALYLCNVEDTDYSGITAFEDHLTVDLGLDALKESQLTDLRHTLKALCQETINLLPFLAYHKIYDDWIRDGRFEPDISQQIYDQIENVSAGYPSVVYTDVVSIQEIAGGARNVGLLYFLMTERFANYGKDYFTTVGDGTQLGPNLNIGPQRLEIYGSHVSAAVASPDGAQEFVGNPSLLTGNPPANPRFKMYNVRSQIYNDGLFPFAGIGEVWAEVNDADQITPVKLRYQMALQRFVERAGVSIGGSKYNDFVFGEYGIRIPDPYLQRSVLVGASTTPVVVHEVITQADGSANDISSNVGDFVGRGHFKGRSRQVRGSVSEHCIYMTIQYVVPQQYYWQGLRKDLSRIDNLSFPHYLFQAVGQELVKNKEIFFGNDPDGNFGYQYRYAFDQMALDEVHGNFRSDLSHWRTGRNMTHVIPPSSDLIRVLPTDCNRIFAYTDSRNMPFFCYTRHAFFHKMPLGDTIGDGRIG